MNSSSENKKYEDAARYRDQLNAITEFTNKQKKARPKQKRKRTHTSNKQHAGRKKTRKKQQRWQP